MPRIRLVRIVTWYLELACGHHLRYTTPGYYPAAVACHTCHTDVAWVIDMWIIKEQTQTVQHHLMPPPTFRTAAAQRPPVAAGARLFTVAVATTSRHHGDLPCHYVLWAATWAEAVTRAAHQCLADHDQPDRSLVTPDSDGMPAIYVTALATGMPLHPADTPGQQWTDLRHHMPAGLAAHLTPHAVLVIAPERITGYQRLATTYQSERDAADTRSALEQAGDDEPVAESVWYSTREAAEDLAAGIAHLFSGPLPTLELHDTGTGTRCAFSHARLDRELPDSGPQCPGGCPHATIQHTINP